MNDQSSPTRRLRGRIRGVVKMLITNGAILVAGAGILGNIWLYFISQINETQIKARQELSTYASYGKFLEKYRADIEPAIGTFLNKKQYLSLEKDPKNLETDGTYKNAEDYKKRCKHLLQAKTTTHTGFELFGLKEYKDYRDIHNFYETLGLSLSSGLISFETVFNMFIYPAYWGKGEEWASVDPFYELELCLRDNWFGEGRPLVDFSDNFLQLGYNYHYRRLDGQVKRLGCHQKTSQNLPEECKALNEKLEGMKAEQRDPKKTSWKQLYPDLCSNVWTLWGRLQNACRT